MIRVVLGGQRQLAQGIAVQCRAERRSTRRSTWRRKDAKIGVGLPIALADMPEKRAKTRRPRRLAVRFGLREPTTLAFASNVSAHGLFMQTNAFFDPGTVIHLEVELPSGPARLVARVSWIRRLPPKLAQGLRGGLGLEVIGSQPGWHAAVAAWERVS